MRFVPSPELLAVLEAKCTKDADLDAFCIYGSIGFDSYLRRDGVVLIGEYDLADDSPPRVSEASPLEAISMIVAAAEWRPELLELLPKRPDNTPQCESCRGTGWLTIPAPHGLAAAAGRWLRAVRRVLGLGDGPAVRVRFDLKPMDDSQAAAQPPRVEIVFRAWRPGDKRVRVCFACHGIGWHAFLR